MALGDCSSFLIPFATTLWVSNESFFWFWVVLTWAESSVTWLCIESPSACSYLSVIQSLSDFVLSEHRYYFIVGLHRRSIAYLLAITWIRRFLAAESLIFGCLDVDIQFNEVFSGTLWLLSFRIDVSLTLCAIKPLWHSNELSKLTCQKLQLNITWHLTVSGECQDQIAFPNNTNIQIIKW